MGFKEWFFKGRIEKKNVEEKRINSLMEEYNSGKVLEIVK